MRAETVAIASFPRATSSAPLVRTGPLRRAGPLYRPLGRPSTGPSTRLAGRRARLLDVRGQVPDQGPRDEVGDRLRPPPVRTGRPQPALGRDLVEERGRPLADRPQRAGH